jgi:hypothetical protein
LGGNLISLQTVFLLEIMISKKWSSSTWVTDCTHWKLISKGRWTCFWSYWTYRTVEHHC